MDLIGKQIPEDFQALIENPIAFFRQNFVLPVKDKNIGIRIVFAAGLTGFDKKIIERSKRKEFGKLFLPFCTLEDLIIYKLFAARPRDIADLHELARIYKNQLGKNYLANMLDDFVKLNCKDMKENYYKIFK